MTSDKLLQLTQKLIHLSKEREIINQETQEVFDEIAILLIKQEGIHG